MDGRAAAKGRIRHNRSIACHPVCTIIPLRERTNVPRIYVYTAGAFYRARSDNPSIGELKAAAWDTRLIQVAWKTGVASCIKYNPRPARLEACAANTWMSEIFRWGSPPGSRSKIYRTTLLFLEPPRGHTRKNASNQGIILKEIDWKAIDRDWSVFLLLESCSLRFPFALFV